MKKILLFSSLFFLFLSCKKDKEVPKPDFGYNYFPAYVGRYAIYDCDSVVYPQITDSVDIFKFQIKEKIDCVFTDNEGREAFRISRYKKLLQKNDSIYVNPQWKIQDVWWMNKTTTTAEVVEENNRYIKLSFPVQEGKTWNGNAQNTLGGAEYEYIYVDEPMTSGAYSFDSTLHVNQYDSKFIVLYKKKYDEKYAKNAGMIWKEITDYTWKQLNGNILFGQIDYGFYYKMQLIDYGTE
jgi:hypothetical protein